MASRSQTKPEISPKIGAKSKASTIQSQPYITLPHLSKKSGTSVDVKVDVKNMMEPDGTGTGTGTGGDQARFFNRTRRYRGLCPSSFTSGRIYVVSIA